MSSMRAIKEFSKGQNKKLLNNRLNFMITSSKNFGFVPIISRILKLRYLIFGSAIGGGIAVHNVSYELK